MSHCRAVCRCSGLGTACGQ